MSIETQPTEQAPAQDSLLTAPASMTQTPAATAPAANPTETPVIKDTTSVPDWKTMLPDDVRNDPSMKAIADIQSLAKSFVHAQKLVGADKVAIPGKHATEDDWDNFFNKIGKPRDIGQYEIKVPESFDKKSMEGFKETAFKNHLLPKQAQAIIDWYSKANQEMSQQIESQTRAQQQEEIQSLKQEWGAAFDTKIARAQMVIKNHADDETIKYLAESGLGNNIKLVRLLAKVGEMYNEDQIRGSGGDPNALSPQDAMRQANDIMSDRSHPYYDKHHPNHKAAVAEVSKLFQMASTARG